MLVLRYAGKLVESGAMLSMVDSVTDNPNATEGVSETMALLEVVAQHNPEALVAAGGMKNLAGLLAAAGAHVAAGHQAVRFVPRAQAVHIARRAHHPAGEAVAAIGIHEVEMDPWRFIGGGEEARDLIGQRQGAGAPMRKDQTYFHLFRRITTVFNRGQLII